MNKKKQEKLHGELATLIRNYGKHHLKKHGNWIILRLNDDWFLQMDSWNTAIYLKQGPGEYNYWNGFSGKTWQYLGGNWGGFNLPQEGANLLSIVQRTKNWIRYAGLTMLENL